MQHMADRGYEMQPWPDVDETSSGVPFPASMDLALSCTHKELNEFADAQPDVVKQNSKFGWFLSSVLFSSRVIGSLS
jgi:hypothetical protein